jgi:hypothetical protein
VDKSGDNVTDTFVLIAPQLRMPRLSTSSNTALPRTRNLVLATHLRPSHDQAGPEKLASEPDLRQTNPVVVSGFITVRLRRRIASGD